MSARDDADGAHRIAGLSVRTHGRPERPALLLSAGLGGQGRYWAANLPALAEHYHVITYDQRGTGDSERAIPRPYELSNMADDLRLILDGLSIASAHVLGHAAGGMAALRLALNFPERVASIAVVNGWDAPDPHFVRCMEIRKAIMRTQGAEAYLRAQPLFLYPAQWISANLGTLDREAAAHAPTFQSEETLFARIDALQRADLRSDLKAVRCPVLLMVALDDMLVPASRGTALRDALAEASVTVEVSATGGHAVNVTRSSWFEEKLLAFLESGSISTGKSER